jgi:hypothetical protein
MKRSDGNDEKGLMNEVLPDPTAAKSAAKAGPRERTSAHLSRLLAAASLAVGGAAGADTTPPNAGKNDGNTPKQGDKPSQPQPPPRHYDVVDPIPQPYIDRSAAPGFLDLSSKPEAEITVDGEATNQKTPQKKLKLTPGVHAITLTVKKPALSESFTVEISSGKTLKKIVDLQPKPKK